MRALTSVSSLSVSATLPRNDELAEQLELLADLSELEGEDSFRVLAYRRAATQIVETGEMEALTKRKALVPEEVVKFMRLPGLGPKTARRIWKELGVTTIGGLKEEIGRAHV